MKILNADYYKDWNFKKHAVFCTSLFLGMYAVNMICSYLIIKRLAK